MKHQIFKSVFLILCALTIFSCTEKETSANQNQQASASGTTSRQEASGTESASTVDAAPVSDDSANPFGENGYFYYCAKYNSVYHVQLEDNKVRYQGYSIRNNTAMLGSLWSDEFDSFYYEIKNNKVVSIIYQDTKMVVTDIKSDSEILRFLKDAATEKIRKICGNYRDEKHKQNILLSESDGKFLLHIEKDDGSIIEDVFDTLEDNGARGNYYYLGFNYSVISLINLKEEAEQEMDYESEFYFPLPYEKVSYFFMPSKITSSSTLVEKNKDSNFYSAENLADNTWKSWCEGTDGDGIGEKLTFDFEKPIKLDTISFRNGYGDLRYYFTNNRVKTISLYINGKYRKDYTLKDMWNWQEFGIWAKEVSQVELVIKDVYPGTKYKDTCISEIYFYRETVNDYDVPVFTFDDMTTECLEKFPYPIYKYRRGLPDSLFYTNDGIPLLLYLSNPTSNWDIYIFYDLDFYVYNPSSKTWKKDNDNPIFAEIKAKSDIAKQEKKPQMLQISDNSDSWFYLSESGEFVFDGFKFTEYVEEPVVYENER